MKSIVVRPEQVEVSPDLDRSRTDKSFEDRLRASIEQIGLVEPLKVAAIGRGRYIIVDGVMRWRAIEALRAVDSSRFRTIPAYLVNHDRRYQIRFQTDIYQDLLPSQLAALVEHLHQSEHITKTEIAAFIGVSGPTLRNYTGLWRLIQRGGLFARIVDLMDAGVVPASNPYAWLRLTEKGLRAAIEMHLANGYFACIWIDQALEEAAGGRPPRLSLQDVEDFTGNLPPDCYREDEQVRSKKRELGLRRAKQQASVNASTDRAGQAIRNLQSVAQHSADPVLREAAESLRAALA